MPANMPPSGASSASSPHSSAAKRAARVLPAIPLPLTRPKTAKIQPQPAVREEARPQQQVVAQVHDVGKSEVVNGHIESTMKEERSLQTAQVARAEAAASSMGQHKLQDKSSEKSLDGIDAVPKESDATGSSSPSAVQSSNPVVESGIAREPSSAFNLGEVRTELPPSFVPSAGHETPKSATSLQSEHQFPSRFQAHPTLASGSSVAFRSSESSESSPAPTDFSNPAFVPPPHLAFNGHQPLDSFLPRLANRPIEPHQHRGSFNRPNQHNPLRDPRNRYSSHQSASSYGFPRGQASFRRPRQDFSTGTERQRQNGFSPRSPPATSPSNMVPLSSPYEERSFCPTTDTNGYSQQNRLAFHEAKPSFHANPRPPYAQVQSHGVPAASRLSNDTFPSDFENVNALRHHIQSHFADPSLADCHIEIIEGHPEGSSSHLDAHRIVLSRSRTLLTAILNTGRPAADSMQVQVSLHLDGPYIRLGTFMEAIKYLYGGTLSQLDRCRPLHPMNETSALNLEGMNIALQHIAVGAWLGLPIIAGRAIEAAGALLHWDTIAVALGFALHGGLSGFWTVDDGSEDRSSAASSDDSSTRPDAAGNPTYEPYSNDLLYRIIDFTVHVFPQDFYLDAAAPQMTSHPRIPELLPGHSSRPSRSDPRLSKIRFGNVPLEEHQRPSATTSTISSLLLTLPFPLLKCVLEHVNLAHRLGPETVASIMRQVVAEREARRTKVLQAHWSAQLDGARFESQTVSNLFWEEFVEVAMQHRAGHRLGRRRKGDETPLGSGAPSEMNS